MLAGIVLELSSCKSKKDPDINLNSSSEFSYDFSFNGCKTGQHRFSTLEEMCIGLKDKILNNSCALEMRKSYFLEKKCVGNFAIDSFERSEEVININRGDIQGMMKSYPWDLPKSDESFKLREVGIFFDFNPAGLSEMYFWLMHNSLTSDEIRTKIENAVKNIMTIVARNGHGPNLHGELKKFRLVHNGTKIEFDSKEHIIYLPNTIMLGETLGRYLGELEYYMENSRKQKIPLVVPEFLGEFGGAQFEKDYDPAKQRPIYARFFEEQLPQLKRVLQKQSTISQLRLNTYNEYVEPLNLYQGILSVNVASLDGDSEKTLEKILNQFELLPLAFRQRYLISMNAPSQSNRSTNGMSLTYRYDLVESYLKNLLKYVSQIEAIDGLSMIQPVECLSRNEEEYRNILGKPKGIQTKCGSVIDGVVNFPISRKGDQYDITPLQSVETEVFEELLGTP